MPVWAPLHNCPENQWRRHSSDLKGVKLWEQRVVQEMHYHPLQATWTSQAQCEAASRYRNPLTVQARATPGRSCLWRQQPAFGRKLVPVPCSPLAHSVKSVCVNFRAVVRTWKPLGVSWVFLVDRGAWEGEPKSSAAHAWCWGSHCYGPRVARVGGPLCLEGTSESALPSGLRAGPVPALYGPGWVQGSDLGRFPHTLFGGDFIGI